MEDPGQSVGFLLSDVSRMLRRNFNERAREHGLSMAQWQALANLAREQGVNQVTLADRLEIQPITLARLLDRLQDAGLVARRPDPGDRRAFRLYLTDAARPLLDRMWAYASETRAEALDGLPDDAREALIGALQHMKHNLLQAEGRSAGATPKAKEADVDVA